MNRLHPVRRNYQPGYPRRLSGAEIRWLLRPSLLRRFSSRTMIGGMMAVGPAVMLGGCGSGASAENAPGLPAGRTTRSDEKLAAKVQQITDEILGSHKEHMSWNTQAGLAFAHPIAANPLVKIPDIPIAFGNSYTGIFDVEEARRATARLFDAWGLKLQNDVSIKADGYQFVADGWNAEQRIGYKLLVPEGNVGFGRPQKLPVQTEAQKLDEQELQAVAQAVADGKLRLLVINAVEYPSMDGDLYTPMQYYMATVVDYLNYVHGDHEISKNTVLGKLPGNKMQRGWADRNIAIAGGDFENAEDLKSWSVSDGGRIERTEEWSDFGRFAMKLSLPAEGQATWLLPTPVKLSGGKTRFAVGHQLQRPKGARLDIELMDEAGRKWVHQNVLQRANEYLDVRADSPPIDAVVKMRIVNRGDEPVVVLIDDIGLYQDKKQP